MLRKSHMLMVALGLVCAGGASASAEDLCVRIGGGGGYVVLKSPPFQFQCCPYPEQNTCAPLVGFEFTEEKFNPGAGGRVTGSGCIDSQGNTFTYHYVYHNAIDVFPNTKGYFETAVCSFELRASTPTLKQPAYGKCRGTALGKIRPRGPQPRTLVSRGVALAMR